MSRVAIRAEKLGKCYRITRSDGTARYKTLRDDLARVATLPWRGLQRLASGRAVAKGGREPFWALDDVSFEVREGEVVGLIGRNGAGKSTLLKLLSRITEPSRGQAEIYGRIGSLLEVGTGFHPELTGRENIFLSGAILGMTRREVDQKFDEIVSFAEVEKFLDTPAKHYSSGMYVRLAFAVAAHLEPEILLVDEVLAVGDASFQKKCLGKMGDVAKGGRTVLFVSHNMQAVRQLCQRAILMDRGRIAADGPSAKVTEDYLRISPRADSPESLESIIAALPPDRSFRLDRIALTQRGEPLGDRVLNGYPLEIEIGYQVLERTTGLRIFFDLVDTDENLLFRSFNDEDAEGIPAVEAGSYVSRAVIPADFLSPVAYELRMFATVFDVRMCMPGVTIPIYVERTGRANKAYLMEPIRGKLAPVIPWTTCRVG